MPTLLLRTCHGSKILQFDTGSSFLSFIANMPNPVVLRMKKFISIYFKVFLKIKLKGHSQFSKKFVDKFCSPTFCAFNNFNHMLELTILSSSKNVSNMFCLIMKILTNRKKTLISLTSFFASSHILSGLSPKIS